MALVVPLLVVTSAVDHRWHSLSGSVIAGAVAFAVFFAVWWFVPQGMGFGDVRLAGAIGVTVGYLSLLHAYVAFFAGFLIGTVFGLVMATVWSSGRKTRIPFGPSLAVGAVFGVLWGGPVAALRVPCRLRSHSRLLSRFALMLRFLTAGESHGRALVVIVEGMPAGLLVTADDIGRALARRRLGFGRGPRMRFEADEVTLVAGVRHGRTLGSPIAIEVANTEWPKWEEEMSPEPGLPSKVLTQPRPGHADLSGMLKYGFSDARDVLERASARETAARVAAGTVAKLLLGQIGIDILSHVVQLGPEQADLDALPVIGRPGPDRRVPGALRRPRGRATDGGRRQGGGQGG